MNIKTMAAAGALMVSAGILQAQQPTTRPADTSSAISQPRNVTRGTLDINTASRSELAAAGWGNYADAIIAGRPYKSMNDLVDKRIVSQAAYDKGAEKFQVGGASAQTANDVYGNPTVPATNPAVPPTTNPGAPTTTTPAPGTVPTTPGTAPTTPGTTPTTPGSPPPSTPGTTAPSGAQPPASPAAPTK